MSLRTRLLVGLAVLVLAAVASSGWLVLRVASAHLEAAEAEAAQALGERVAAVLSKTGSDRAALVEAARALQTGGVADEVAAIDARGTALVGEPDGALRGALGGSSFVIRKSASLYVYVPLRGAGGALRIKLDDKDRVTAALERARKLLWAVALVDAALVLAFGALFIRRVIGPLEALAASSRRVAEGDLDVQVAATTRGDEVARLTDDFNRMTKNLRAQRDRLVAQEKLASVGQLAAGVAHEVGNPLAAVLGYVELLLRDTPSDLETRDALERIRRETERIRTIISDLLDYARPPRGDLEPVAMREAVEAAVSLLRPQARFREVIVDIRVDVALPAVAANGNRVIQILINLFLNAADAMGGKGAVTVEGARAGEGVELRISDSGPGVPVGDRARVFDPFFTTKDPGAGTGLGLSISRSIAEAYGGTLTLDEGATFVLRLPMVK